MRHSITFRRLWLREHIGIPHTLASLNVTEALIPKLAAQAIADPTAPTNPRPLSVTLLEELFKKALHGDLSSYD